MTRMRYSPTMPRTRMGRSESAVRTLLPTRGDATVSAQANVVPLLLAPMDSLNPCERSHRSAAVPVGDPPTVPGIRADWPGARSFCGRSPEGAGHSGPCESYARVRFIQSDPRDLAR